MRDAVEELGVHLTEHRRLRLPSLARVAKRPRGAVALVFRQQGRHLVGKQQRVALGGEAGTLQAARLHAWTPSTVGVAHGLGRRARLGRGALALHHRPADVEPPLRVELDARSEQALKVRPPRLPVGVGVAQVGQRPKVDRHRLLLPDDRLFVRVPYRRRLPAGKVQGLVLWRTGRPSVARLAERRHVPEEGKVGLLGAQAARVKRGRQRRLFAREEQRVTSSTQVEPRDVCDHRQMEARGVGLGRGKPAVRERHEEQAVRLGRQRLDQLLELRGREERLRGQLLPPPQLLAALAQGHHVRTAKRRDGAALNRLEQLAVLAESPRVGLSRRHECHRAMMRLPHQLLGRFGPLAAAQRRARDLGAQADLAVELARLGHRLQLQPLLLLLLGPGGLKTRLAPRVALVARAGAGVVE